MTHPLSRGLLTAVLVSLLTACATASCPTSTAMPCLTKRVCTTDAKGCETCTCEAAPQRRPEQDQPGKPLAP